MSSRRPRRLFLRICWLALLCTAAMAAATPDVAVDGSQASRVALTSIVGGPAATLPAAAPAAGSEIDDLVATQASRPFRLDLLLRHCAPLRPETARVYSHSPPIAGERGPPALA